jgi:hypothetical protein
MLHWFCFVKINMTTWINETAPVQHKKTTWIDKTAPVQHEKDVALVLFCLSMLSFLFCTGAVLSIQVFFSMLHWCCFVYPGCFLCTTTWIDKTAPVQHKKTTWIDKTAPVQHKKDNLDRQKRTSATLKRQPG